LVPDNLRDTLKEHAPSLDPINVYASASKQLQDLYISDFEMTRLKEINETLLLRFYLVLEKNLPPGMMFLAGSVMKLIVIFYRILELTPGIYYSLDALAKIYKSCLSRFRLNSHRRSIHDNHRFLFQSHTTQYSL
jgi:hypothetical protein